MEVGKIHEDGISETSHHEKKRERSMKLEKLSEPSSFVKVQEN